MMAMLEGLPDPIKEVHSSLKKYLRQRHEAANIRQILASHLGTCLDAEGHHKVSRPLSIIDILSVQESASSGMKGTRREYLRSIKANVSARKEYDAAVKEHQFHAIHSAEPTREQTRNGSVSTDGAQTCLDPFIELIISTRKHDRLRIFHDYLDMISQKPAAEATHFEAGFLLKAVKSIPEIPREVMDMSGLHAESKNADLGDLVSRLEKSVLRAKLLLKKEQKLLSEVKNTNNRLALNDGGGKLDALGITRNELIKWIEMELGKTNESPEDISNHEQECKPGSQGERESIERHHISIQRQYSQYTKAREALIRSATQKPEFPSSEVLASNVGTSENKIEWATTKALPCSVHPYLEELTAISNEQKSVLQQKSHLTTSLAKQLKESMQGLDLLAEESHLLPAYPLPANPKASSSFADEMSNLEKPNSSRKAKEWVFASGSAGVDTRSAVLGKLEEGEVAVSGSQKALRCLQDLLGIVDNQKESAPDALEYADVWETLDGRLGVIKGDV